MMYYPALCLQLCKAGSPLYFRLTIVRLHIKHHFLSILRCRRLGFHVSDECEQSRCFFTNNPLTMQERRLLKEIISQRPFHTPRKSLELAIGNRLNMASAPSSSSRPNGPQKGDWESFSISHAHLNKLQTQGYLPPADLISVRAGLTSIDGEALAENFPNPSKEERVCFVSFLLRGI